MQVRRSPTAEPRRGAPPDLGLLSESSRTSPEVRRTSPEVRRTFFLDLFSGPFFWTSGEVRRTSPEVRRTFSRDLFPGTFFLDLR